MKNLEIAEIFHQIANILEIKGENVFRIRAYERAAMNIEGIPNLDNFVKDDRLTDIPGIGHDLSAEIKEYYETGKVKMLETLKKTIPEGLLELLDVPGIGPKHAKLFFEKLGIKSIADLERAIKEGGLKGLEGIKEKTIENISKGIGIVKRGKERMTIAQASEIADEFVAGLKKVAGVKKVAAAGSLRRWKDTVGDIDILVVSRDPQKVMDVFTKFEPVKDVLAKGETKSAIRTKDDVQVDCRVVEDRSYGAALVYFTGSKDFNIKLRKLAIKKGLKVSEYGVFRQDKYLCGRTEEEVFKQLGLSYIEPELREDTGEIELALTGKLPKLIELKDIKGDLHAHSKWSDGGSSIEEMAQEAKRLGYSYLAMTDHSQSLKIARGLSIESLKKKKAEIDGINRKLKDFKVLFGTEVDIDSSGKIDYKDDVLKQFDIVVAAVHIGFKQSGKQLTNRVVKACKNKYVQIIAHPTARLWGVRQPYDIDLDEVFKAAKDTGTALEINAFPQRLDLNDTNCRLAKEAKVKIVINTDSHQAEQLKSMRYGVAVARRGWLSKEDVLNCLSLDKLLKTLKK